MKTTKKIVGRIDDAIGIEISAVDRPANEYSTITAVELAKRAEPEPTVEEVGIIKKFLAWLRKSEAPAAEEEELTAMAGLTLEQIIEAVRKDNKEQEVEKTGRKISAANLEHIDNTKKALKNAQSYIGKAVDAYPDDDNIGKGAAHLGSAMDHITKMDFTPTTEEVQGGVTSLASPPKTAAASTEDLAKMVKDALASQLAPMNEKIEKAAAENAALTIENAKLKGAVEALGSQPAPRRSMAFTPAVRGAEQIANAGGETEKAEVIDPKDPGAFAKAYTQRVLTKPQLVGQSTFNGSAGK